MILLLMTKPRWSLPTAIRMTDSLPRPHISRGYTAQAPAAPAFESEPKVRIPDITNRQEIRLDGTHDPFVSNIPVSPVPAGLPGGVASADRGRTRRIVTFFIFVGIFTGLLYGTASYMRGRGVLPELGSIFGAKTAIANTDIYLRPAPNTENDPIGLVTKNSKVRIVNSQNNWYQVDVIEQGRARPTQPSASRGWLNGKFLDMESN